jgi:hypothetical protein
MAGATHGDERWNLRVASEALLLLPWVSAAAVLRYGRSCTYMADAFGGTVVRC